MDTSPCAIKKGATRLYCGMHRVGSTVACTESVLLLALGLELGLRLGFAIGLELGIVRVRVGLTVRRHSCIRGHQISCWRISIPTLALQT